MTNSVETDWLAADVATRGEYCRSCGTPDAVGSFCSSCGACLEIEVLEGPDQRSQVIGAVIGLLSGTAILIGAFLPWGSATAGIFSANSRAEISDVLSTALCGLVVLTTALFIALTNAPRRSIYVLRAALIFVSFQLGAVSYNLYRAWDAIQLSDASEISVSVSPGVGIILIAVAALLLIACIAAVANSFPYDNGAWDGVLATALFVLFGLLGAFSMHESVDGGAVAATEQGDEMATPTSTTTTTTSVVPTIENTYVDHVESPPSDSAELPSAMATVDARGYDPTGTSGYEEYASNSSLQVILGTRQGMASSTDQRAFFFYKGQYLGTDSTDPSAGIELAWRDDSTIALNYRIYAESDSMCCPSMGSKTVRFYWNGSQLKNLDPLPPTENVDGSRL